MSNIWWFLLCANILQCVEGCDDGDVSMLAFVEGCWPNHKVSDFSSGWEVPFIFQIPPPPIFWLLSFGLPPAIEQSTGCLPGTSQQCYGWEGLARVSEIVPKNGTTSLELDTNVPDDSPWTSFKTYLMQKIDLIQTSLKKNEYNWLDTITTILFPFSCILYQHLFLSFMLSDGTALCSWRCHYNSLPPATSLAPSTCS